MNFLEKDKRYINQDTGSIDTGENWEADFEEFYKDKHEVWRLWGGEELIETREGE